MKIRSKQLFLYLLEKNIDFQDKEALAQAKSEYRRLYKKKWKTGAKKNKEVRPTFTEYEYQELYKRAELLGLLPTTYVRELVLSSQENRELIPNKEQLLKVLQCISMALINHQKCTNEEIKTLLEQAEESLIVYLK